MYFNKKSSLEMSIQAIVIVVLAMTLLGLGLGFIKGMFRNITSTTEGVSEQVRQKILDDLIQGDKKISFPKTEVIIDKGGSAVLSVGIRNKGETELKYNIRFTPVTAPGNQQFTIDNPKWFQYDESEFKLGSAQNEVRNIRLSIPDHYVISGASRNVDAGSYFLTFDVLEQPGNKIYDSKDFFVVVRG